MGQIPSIDQVELTDVVRLHLQRPSFELLDWSVRVLSDRGAINPEGVLCVSGTGHDAAGMQSWAVALKLIVPGEYGDHPSQKVYWKREMLAYTSGTLAHLAGPVEAARCYRAREAEQQVWLWMEVLTDVTGGQWTLHDYAFVAEQFGRFNGMCARDTFQPDAPWLARTIAREWTAKMDFATAWQKSHVQAAFAAPMRPRFEQLARDRERFLPSLSRCHRSFAMVMRSVAMCLSASVPVRIVRSLRLTGAIAVWEPWVGMWCFWLVAVRGFSIGSQQQLLI